MTTDQNKDDVVGKARLRIASGLTMSIIAAVGSIVVWNGWIPESSYDGTRVQKTGLWLFGSTAGLLWAINAYLELRAYRIGTARSRKQFEVTRDILGILAFLVMSVVVSFLIGISLMIFLGPWIAWFDDRLGLSTSLVMAVMLLTILAVYIYLRSRWKDDDVSALTLAALLGIAPFAFVAFAGFIAVFLTLALSMAAAVLGFQEFGSSIERNTGLCVGITMIVIALAIFAIYLLRRDSTANLGNRLLTLSTATGTVLRVAGIVTFGGLAMLIVAALLKVTGIMA